MISTKNSKPRQPGTIRAILFIAFFCLIILAKTSIYNYFIRPPADEDLIAMRDRDDDKPTLYYKNREANRAEERAPYKYSDPSYYQGRPDPR